MTKQENEEELVFTDKEMRVGKWKVQEICKNCGHEISFHEIDDRGYCIYGSSYSSYGLIQKGCPCKKFTPVQSPETKLGKGLAKNLIRNEDASSEVFSSTTKDKTRDTQTLSDKRSQLFHDTIAYGFDIPKIFVAIQMQDLEFLRRFKNDGLLNNYFKMKDIDFICRRIDELSGFKEVEE